MSRTTVVEEEVKVEDLSSKSDTELLLMIRDQVKRIKEIVGELKSSYSISTTTAAVVVSTNTAKAETSSSTAPQQVG
ncbi:MAG: hypothetical protein ABI341_03420 [Nitrososphaera sp.]|jgi:hypothetical protein|uniref:hypothetical protein n=1 Tax=Candidatus Nitrosocaldus islandicus TaxID=2045011 RepID=UPI0011E59F89|nr:hypothetical protein [Candidatus Nitrosocaldus islandicus]